MVLVHGDPARTAVDLRRGNVNEALDATVAGREEHLQRARGVDVVRANRVRQRRAQAHGREVKDNVGLFDGGPNGLAVGDVRADHPDGSGGSQVVLAAHREVVEHRDAVVARQQVGKVAADETGAAGDQDTLALDQQRALPPPNTATHTTLMT